MESFIISEVGVNSQQPGAAINMPGACSQRHVRSAVK